MKEEAKHREAKTTAAINSKTKRPRRLELQDEDAFPRDALYARRVNSRAFPTHVGETQPVPAARHNGHYYDRSWRRDGSPSNRGITIPGERRRKPNRHQGPKIPSLRSFSR